MKPNQIPKLATALLEKLGTHTALKDVYLLPFQSIDWVATLHANCARALKPCIAIVCIQPESSVTGLEHLIISQLSMCIQIHIPKLAYSLQSDLYKLAQGVIDCLQLDTIAIDTVTIRVLPKQDIFLDSIQTSKRGTTMNLKFNLLIEDSNYEYTA